MILDAQTQAQIDNMSHLQMARLWRFAPVGHPFFETGSPVGDYFQERFKALGGMTPDISKRLGWGDDEPAGKE